MDLPTSNIYFNYIFAAFTNLYLFLNEIFYPLANFNIYLTAGLMLDSSPANNLFNEQVELANSLIVVMIESCHI
jgi:hypothetical protein